MTVNTMPRLVSGGGGSSPSSYLDSLLSLLPSGAKYNEIGFALSQLARLFPDDLQKADPEDIKRWVAEIDSGARTERSIRNDIFRYYVGAEKIQNRLGVDAATATALIDGTKTFADVERPVGNELLTDGNLIRVRNPAGSDAAELYFVTYEWRGVTFVYEIGDRARLNELFGSPDAFDSFTTQSQAQFDNNDFVSVGLIDQELGSTETIASRLERETREAGLEDLPEWLANSPEALALIANAEPNGWSPGRLWKELAETAAFKSRFGGAIDRYLQDNVTVQEAVQRLVADENQLRQTLTPFLTRGQQITTAALQQMLTQGWTATAAGQVLEVAEDMRRDPNSLARTNFILRASGLEPLTEVGYINALRGHGTQDVIEALNTTTAARALSEAGLDLSDDDVELIMGLVDTTDRLQTVDSWRELAQGLAFNAIRFNAELDAGKLGIDEDDLIAAAFGREAPSGKSSGEVMGLLARFERDRRAASEGFEGSSGFIDDRGRLRIQGLSGV